MESWKVTFKELLISTSKDSWTDIWKAQIWYALPFRRTIREVENPCGSCPCYIREVLRLGLLPISHINKCSCDLWNIGISRQANYILRIEIIELIWTIPRLMGLKKVEVDQKCTSSSSHLVKTVGNKEVLFSD